MAYCTLAELYNQISLSDLIALTDDTGTDGPNTTVIAKAIADADAEINAYLCGKYSVPLSPVPPIINKISVDLAIYHLTGRRNMTVPEDRKTRHDDGISFLKDVQKGIAAIDASTPVTVSIGPISTKTVDDRVITMDRLSEY